MERHFSASEVIIGITTFNRIEFVSACARSLGEMADIENCEVIVLDDASTQFSGDYLKKIFPAHANIVVNETNSGRADFAARSLYERMCATGKDIVVSVDSDMIFQPDMIERVLAGIGETDGVLSLFNTRAHPAIMNEEYNFSHSLIEKATIGNGAVAWRRELLADIVENVPPSDRWDWDYCHYLQSAKKRIFCLQNSAVQHLGIGYGQNSYMLSGDYGVGFSGFSNGNTAVMLEVLVDNVKYAVWKLGNRLDELEKKVDALSVSLDRGQP